jgi:hypothetical protein
MENLTMDFRFSRAVLFYGFLIDPEKGLDKPWDLSNWQAVFAARAGVTDPALKERLILNAPGQILSLGTLESPSFALAFQRAQWASSGSLSVVPPHMLTIADHDEVRFRSFAKLNGIKWPESGVGWLMAVMEPTPQAPSEQPAQPGTEDHGQGELLASGIGLRTELNSSSPTPTGADAETPSESGSSPGSTSSSTAVDSAHVPPLTSSDEEAQTEPDPQSISMDTMIDPNKDYSDVP